jgi:hypothetical protein
VSAHETTSLVAAGGVALVVVVGASASSCEDDVVDAMSLLVLAVVGATIGAALVALGALLTYVATPVASGDAWRKVVFNDAVNFALYLLRVALCWSRYVFYDAQVEGVDIALQQTDALFTHTSHADVSRLARAS